MVVSDLPSELCIVVYDVAGDGRRRFSDHFVPVKKSSLNKSYRSANRHRRRNERGKVTTSAAAEHGLGQGFPSVLRLASLSEVLQASHPLISSLGLSDVLCYEIHRSLRSPEKS